MSDKSKRQIKIKSTINVDIKKLSKFFNRLASGNRFTSHSDIIGAIQDCIYIKKGQEKRSITREEAAQFIKTGTLNKPIKPTQERSA